MDHSRSVIHCPLQHSDYAVFQRAHELAHVRWTPPDAACVHAGVSHVALQVVEDMRMHAKLSAAGVDVSHGGVPPELLSKIRLGVLSRGDAILCGVGSYGTGDFEPLVSLAGGHAEVVREVSRFVHAKLAETDFDSFDATVDVARELTAMLGLEASAPDDKFAAELLYDGPLGGRDVDDEDAGHDGEGVEHETHPTSVGPGPDAKPFAGRAWGRMTIDEPNRPLPSTSRRSCHQARDYGTYLRNPHRMPVDGRVFSTKKTARAVSLLIDASGSMSLSDQNLVTILRAVPAAVVACYSGDRDKGVLRVLAKDGRRVTGDLVTRPSGCCNVIDGPALDWLAAQPAPRFWLSDGGVTGIGDVGGSWNTEYAKNVCDRARITRHGKIKDLLAAVRIAARRGSPRPV